MRWASASVSVSEVSRWPRASRPSRSSRKFSMIPLWMTVISPVQSWCGWALRSLGRPCVAQRVWARPIAACGRPVRDGRLQVGQLAGLLLDEQVAGVVDQGDPRGVVAAVLETLEPGDEDRAGLAGPGVADDAAHAGRSSVRARRYRDRRVVRLPRWAPAASVDAPCEGRERVGQLADERRVLAFDHDPQGGLRAGRPDEDPTAVRRGGASRRRSPGPGPDHPPTGPCDGRGRRAVAAAGAGSRRRARRATIRAGPSRAGPRAR